MSGVHAEMSRSHAPLQAARFLSVPLLALSLAAAPPGANGPSARRTALIEAARDRGPEAIPALIEALHDRNPIVRRTAVRLLARLSSNSEGARRALTKAAVDPDVLVRRTALLALWKAPDAKAVQWFEAALPDPDPSVRLMAAQQLAARRPRTDEITNLLQQAAQDKDDRVRAVASRAIWPFHREDRSIRRRSDWDHTVTVLQTMPLPRDGWRFQLDPKRIGHLRKWFSPDFDDSDWAVIAIEQAWQKAGYDYIGVAWYRRWIDLPPKPGGMNAVEICFDGVDECAWVWVNGKYVGEHDIGPSGWNQPFTLDITQEVKWGARNLIVVRAKNTAHAGGIWRPVRIEVLK